jgi:hypothetical protein
MTERERTAKTNLQDEAINLQRKLQYEADHQDSQCLRSANAKLLITIQYLQESLNE